MVEEIDVDHWGVGKGRHIKEGCGVYNTDGEPLPRNAWTHAGVRSSSAKTRQVEHPVGSPRPPPPTTSFTCVALHKKCARGSECQGSSTPGWARSRQSKGHETAGSTVGRERLGR